MSSKTVFLTGANGFIGSNVAKAFSQRGWTTYGLMRSDRSSIDLAREEVIPIIGTAHDVSSFVSTLPALDVIITCDEDLSDYVTHHEARLSMIKQLCKHSKTRQGAVKPLVIFSSGCKDYGTTPLHGVPGLEAHTETSPLNPPDLLRPRTEAALDMLTNHTDDFDCVVTRPTTLYGRSGSHYTYFFSLAERAKQECDGVLDLPAHPNAILHGTHVDDVATAYFTLATAPRSLVAGQTFNISGHRYETLAQIASAIERAHGITIKYHDSGPSDAESFGLYAWALLNFSQWVGSQKIREELGWKDEKPLFSEGYGVFRAAWEAARVRDPEQVERVMARKAPGTL
jgi:nucleoside-diphosphate-sugar epimerase